MFSIMNYKIIFENEHLVIVDKPSMVLTTPSRMGKGDERPCLGIELQNSLNQQIYPIHRLDFEVSGLVMFAKTPHAHRECNLWFDHKTVHKTYEALTEGKSEGLIANQQLIWKCNLLRGKKRAYESPHGKPSITHATYLGMSESFLKWELNPVTGRSHQLRFDLFRHGFPIVGDELYGAKSQWKQSGIALRSVKINFADTKNFAEFGLPSNIITSSLF